MILESARSFPGPDWTLTRRDIGHTFTFFGFRWFNIHIIRITHIIISNRFTVLFHMSNVYKAYNLHHFAIRGHCFLSWKQLCIVSLRGKFVFTSLAVKLYLLLRYYFLCLEFLFCMVFRDSFFSLHLGQGFPGPCHLDHRRKCLVLVVSCGFPC